MATKKKSDAVEETAEEVKAEETAAETEAPAKAEAAAEEKPAKAKKPAASKAKADAPADDASGSQTKGKKRSERIGIVFSDKMTDTVVVRVDRKVMHPLYRKYVRKRKKFMAHDVMGAAEGDKVKIVETRPLSKRKRWRVVEIIQKAEK